MAKDIPPHPSAKLVSISKLSFWIYWIVCLLLYVANYFYTSPNPGKLRTTGVSALILICIFVALMLNVIESNMGNKKIKPALSLFNNVFMIASLPVIVLWMILK